MATYKIYEYTSSLKKADRKLVYTCTSAESVCEYIKREYDINTRRSDLLYALEQNYGDAWLYPFWGFIQVTRG